MSDRAGSGGFAWKKKVFLRSAHFARHAGGYQPWESAAATPLPRGQAEPTKASDLDI